MIFVSYFLCAIHHNESESSDDEVGHSIIKQSTCNLTGYQAIYVMCRYLQMRRNGEVGFNNYRGLLAGLFVILMLFIVILLFLLYTVTLIYKELYSRPSSTIYNNI
jgi:hypothetical protein